MSAFGGKPSGLRLARMKASARYVAGTSRGGVGGFRNTHPAQPGLKRGTALPTMREFLCGGQRRVPASPLPSFDPRERWSKAAESGLRATWLGHPTVLLEIDGARVLTDPVWGERVSPVSFAGPKRFQPVPLAIAALPPLDAVVISHDHYDHLDHPSILALARTNVPFVTSLGVGAHLEAWGVPNERIIELDWWEHVTLPKVTITAAPSQHFSGRAMGDRNTTLWSSMVVRGARHTVFFSGDTGLTPEYAEIRQRLGPFDLVMLEVGAFHPAWGDIHLGPANALEALTLLGGGSFLPVHWGTFNLAMHAWDEPAESLLALAPRVPGARLLMPRIGEPVEPSRADRVDPWWRPVAAAEKGDAGAKAQVTEEEAAVTEATLRREGVEWPMD